MKKLIFNLLFCPLLLSAQVNGVEFMQNLNWHEILKKAQIDNKYVFVDCYAAWCVPCRWMDENVYSNDSIGRYMNERFICVKIAMDSANRDHEDVRSWYAALHSMNKDLSIDEYPSYLFYSPEGKLVHRGVGALHREDFISLTEAALDNRKQYYTLLFKYEHGKLDAGDMPYLADAARKLHVDSVAFAVAANYIHNYLEGLPMTTIWSRENLRALENFRVVVHSSDLIFRRYFHDRVKIDSIVGSRGHADALINYVLYKEEIDPFVSSGIKDGNEPDWRKLQKAIRRKYGNAYVGGNVLKGRVEYYRGRKKWERYAKFLVKRVQVSDIQSWPFGRISAIILNNNAYDVFKYSNDKKELEIALSWVERADTINPRPDADRLDTKANLLYKLGRKAEALALEEKSHSLSPEDMGIKVTLDRMKQGMPTWQ